MEKQTVIKDLISIIIPVYNVEKYVKRCITSVQNQLYKNIEIIIVDDGSTDRSGEICEELSAKDTRMTVFHKTNGGLSSARNTGIAASHGKYIAFVDSDDFIHEEYILIMHRIIIESGSDIVICDYEKGSKSKFRTNDSGNSYKEYTSSQMLENWHADLCAQETSSCNKLILREMLVQMEFCYPEGVYHEDIMTTHLLIESARKVAVTNRKLYYYYQRKNSITKRIKNEKNIRDNLTAQDMRLDFFAGRGYSDTVGRLMIGRQKYYMLMYCMTNSKDIKTELKNRFKCSYKSIMKFDDITWIEKAMFFIFNIFFIRI